MGGTQHHFKPGFSSRPNKPETPAFCTSPCSPCSAPTLPGIRPSLQRAAFRLGQRQAHGAHVVQVRLEELGVPLGQRQQGLLGEQSRLAVELLPDVAQGEVGVPAQRLHLLRGLNPKVVLPPRFKEKNGAARGLHPERVPRLTGVLETSCFELGRLLGSRCSVQRHWTKFPAQIRLWVQIPYPTPPAKIGSNRGCELIHLPTKMGSHEFRQARPYSKIPNPRGFSRLPFCSLRQHARRIPFGHLQRSLGPASPVKCAPNESAIGETPGGLGATLVCTSSNAKWLNSFKGCKPLSAQTKPLPKFWGTPPPPHPSGYLTQNKNTRQPKIDFWGSLPPPPPGVDAPWPRS